MQIVAIHAGFRILNLNEGTVLVFKFTFST